MSDATQTYEILPMSEGSAMVEVRSTGKKKLTIGGYAAVFGRASENLGGFTERVDPLAFNVSRGEDWPHVLARYNHSDSMVLGSTAARTLRLNVDEHGLFYDVDLPASRGDVWELVERRDISRSSFAFHAVGDAWAVEAGGMTVRTLNDVRLIDVAPVTRPAYPDATVGLRSLARHTDAPIEDVIKLAKEGELRKLLTRTDRGERRAVTGHEARNMLARKQFGVASERQCEIDLARHRRIIELDERRYPEGVN